MVNPYYVLDGERARYGKRIYYGKRLWLGIRYGIDGKTDFQSRYQYVKKLYEDLKC